MTTNNSGNNSGSATIYTFPPRGRFAVRDQREDFAPAATMPLPREVKLVSGSAWYHDEAIQNAIRDSIKPVPWRKG
jgi:hypothetical protein